MNTHESELSAAVERMEAVRRYIEQLAPVGTDLGAAYAELDAAVREYEVVVPKWRDERMRR